MLLSRFRGRIAIYEPKLINFRKEKGSC